MAGRGASRVVAVLLVGIGALTCAPPTSAAVDAIVPVWDRVATGAVWDLEVADGNVLTAMFGIQSVGPGSLDGHGPAWATKWPATADGLGGGDTDLGHDMGVGDFDDDGTVDAVAAHDGGLVAVSGVDGTVLWKVTPPAEIFSGVQELAVGDLSGDGVPDVAYAYFLDRRIEAVDGRDGSSLWTFSRTPAFTARIEIADLNGDGANDVLATAAGGTAAELWALNGSLPQPVPLWIAKTGDGDPTSLAVGEAAASPGPEIAVGGYGGAVDVFSAATGTRLMTGELDGHVTDVALANLDGIGPEEVVAAHGHNDDNGSSATVAAFGVTSGPEPIWIWQAPEPPMDLETSNLDGDAADELLVAGGWWAFRGKGPEDGFAAALDAPAAGPATLWVHRTQERIGSVRRGPVFGQDTVVLGDDVAGGITALAPDGSVRWTHRTGGVAADVQPADLDGDGLPEVLEAGQDGYAAAYSTGGRRLWERRAPGTGGPDVLSVGGGDLTGDGRDEAISGTFEYARSAPGGRLYVHASDGSVLWEAQAPGNYGEIAVSGGNLIAGSAGVGLGGDDSQVARFAGDGTLRWRVGVPPSLFGMIVRPMQMDGGVADVAVGTLPAFARGHVLLLDGTSGATVWDWEARQAMQWMDTTGDPADGYFAGDSGGVVSKLDATGKEVWNRQAVTGAARRGEIVSDVTGDGVRDLAITADDGFVRLLNGADGSEEWATLVGGGDRLAYVVTTARADGMERLVAGTASYGFARGRIAVLDPKDGSLIDSRETEGDVLDMTPADLDGDGRDEIVAAAGQQLHAVRVFADLDPAQPPVKTPDTSPSPSPSPSSGESTPGSHDDRGVPPLALPGPGVRPMTTTTLALRKARRGRLVLRGRIVNSPGCRAPAIVRIQAARRTIRRGAVRADGSWRVRIRAPRRRVLLRAIPGAAPGCLSLPSRAVRAPGARRRR